MANSKMEPCSCGNPKCEQIGSSPAALPGNGAPLELKPGGVYAIEFSEVPTEVEVACIKTFAVRTGIDFLILGPGLKITRSEA